MNKPNRKGAQPSASLKVDVEAIAAALVAIKTQRAARDGEIATRATKKTLLAMVDKKLVSIELRHASDHRKADV